MPFKILNPTSVSLHRALFIAALARFFLFVATLFLVDNLIDLASYPYLLITAGAMGIGSAVIITPCRVTSRGIATVTIIALLLFHVVLGTFLRLPPFGADSPLTPYIIAEHATLATWTFLALTLSSVIVFRHRWAVTSELFALLSGVVCLLAAHRNLHIDKPKFIASLAWDLNLEYLSTFLVIAAVCLGGVLSYITALSLNLGRADVVSAVAAKQTPLRRLSRLIPPIIVILSLWGLGEGLYHSMKKSVGSRAANGVGQANQEGISPLNFHSAVGGTAQPAALVRLDGDYPENPFTKKLYLRESALSQLADNALVMASTQFDQDVFRGSPHQPFHRDKDTSLDGRIELPQSIFLIAMAENPFAVDYPTSMVPLKNPRPDRFKSAYRALSLAPTFSIENLASRDVGDPRWSDDERLHYTIYHPDYRYAEFAKKITAGVTGKVSQALAIADWLSKNAIYTLQPNHEIPTGGDPVEPFLFGDLRGYCVHFAHATVYLLRSLGIPSRIATGYMTDLSQSKDGHILLRMSDRHSWAEVYVTGAGWVPFDTQPEQVESHADSPVDVKALEELMGMIGPDEEILAPSDISNEPGMEDTRSRWSPPSPQIVLWGLSMSLVFLLMVKVFLRFGWMGYRSCQGRLRASFRAVISILRDAGLPRHEGETYSEYEERITCILGSPCFLLRPVLLRTTYGPQGTLYRLSSSEIDRLRTRDLEVIRAHLKKRRWRSFSSLRSAVAFLRGELS
jgi:hypothetical protein